MHPIVHLILLAGSCLAHYRFETRNLLERDDPREKGEWVNCPVCETPRYSSLVNREVCEMHEGRSMKLCQYGTYINDVCGSRRDCYRGPNEFCTEKENNDVFGQECAPGYTCSGSVGTCKGLGSHYKSGELQIMGNRYLLGTQQRAI